MTKQSSARPAKSGPQKGKRASQHSAKPRAAKSSQEEYRSLRRAFLTSLAVFVLAVSTVVVMSFLAAHTIGVRNSADRLSRIKNIYANLNLGNDYTVTNAAVFGDKRVYSWDKSRTYSSEIDYLHGDTVSNTVADIDAKIKALGFVFIGEPYPGSHTTQYHYKSSDGEYIRLTVGSKQYYDALTNAAAMKTDTDSALKDINTNSAPSQVIIKVNLDDNNE